MWKKVAFTPVDLIFPAMEAPTIAKSVNINKNVKLPLVAYMYNIQEAYWGNLYI